MQAQDQKEEIRQENPITFCLKKLYPYPLLLDGSKRFGVWMNFEMCHLALGKTSGARRAQG